MERPLLNEPGVFPSGEVLENALGPGYGAYESMMTAVAAPEYALIAEWRYYRDGKAWLCKVCHKKKTIFWLSVWPGFFKTSFYFLARHSDGVIKLGIHEAIKNDFKNRESFGNLIPLVIKVYKEEQIKDVLEVIRYKKSIK